VRHASILGGSGAGTRIRCEKRQESVAETVGEERLPPGVSRIRAKLAHDTGNRTIARLMWQTCGEEMAAP
jgi:hypothetical protein